MRKVRNQSRRAISTARRFRSNMGEAEKRLWAILRREGLGFKFRRQHAVDRYFLDFYCAKVRLCVELDGELHLERRENDELRDAAIAELGIETFRVTTLDLYESPEEVAGWIHQACVRRADEPGVT